MRIHLFNDGTAVITGMNTHSVTCDKCGVFKIGSMKMPIFDSKECALPMLSDGCYTASVTIETGKEYRVGYVSIHNGGIVPSRVSEKELMLHHELDRANDKIEELTAKVDALEKIFDTDSLNFLLSKK